MVPDPVTIKKIEKKLSTLPAYRLKEVMDFIDFLQDRDARSGETILDVAGCLSGPPLTSEEIEEELYGQPHP